MDYKVLINLFVPEIERDFQLYIPINRTISQVSNLIVKLIISSTNGILPDDLGCFLYNFYTGELYDGKSIIRETNIKNGTKLVLIF